MKRNKLKRNNTKLSKDGEKNRATTAAIAILHGNCYDGETSQGKPSVSAMVERKSSFSEGFKVAPIFLAADQRRKNDGGPDTKKPDAVSNWTGEPVVTPRRGGELSFSGQENCLKEIQKFNPAFPVSTVFSSLIKKASQESQSADSWLNKRKSRSEVSQRLPKRLRTDTRSEAAQGSCVSGENERKTIPERRELSCSLSSFSSVDLVSHTTPVAEPTTGSDDVQEDSWFEDVLWTDKYAPQNSSEVIGNTASVNKLHSWLQKWKRRADGDERRQMEESKKKENSSWDCGDFQGEAGLEDGGAEPLGKAVLLTGPSGVGKTAAVYACAQELSFKVFEVNCSSQRSGRLVLSQLKETTQSHIVDIPGHDPLKPAYFNNYSTNSITPKSVALPVKRPFPKNITSTSKKRAPRNSSGRKFKAKSSNVTLARYFKMKERADGMGVPDKSATAKQKTDGEENLSAGCDHTVPHDKRTATSLILFEEVDVIFEDDVGFLTAIKAFITTTKRPVVLTTTDSSFKARFDCNLEEIIFKTPSAMSVCSYLQLVCLAENFRLPSDDASGLYRLASCDVRRCLLQLQLWVNSSRGWSSQAGALAREQIGSHPWNTTARRGLDFPSWQTGCSAHMLGLHPVTPNSLLNFIQLGSCSEIDLLPFMETLSESWRRGVPLLYSNLELLLSIGAHRSDSRLDTKTRCLSDDQQRSPICVKSSRLSRRRFTRSVSDSKATSVLSSKPPRASSFAEPRSSLEKPGESAAKAICDCLDGLADFFDVMSSIDAMLPRHTSGQHTAQSFVWTGAALKDGLSDDPGDEDCQIRKQDGLREIKAAAEGLAFLWCWWSFNEAWTEAHRHKQKIDAGRWNSFRERLLLTTSWRGQNLSFTAQPRCAPSVSDRRYRLSRKVLGSKFFGLLGNRRAVCVDYLPVLRLVCRALAAKQHEGELGRHLSDFDPHGCWSYQSGNKLGLSKSAIELLAEDFTSTKVTKNL